MFRHRVDFTDWKCGRGLRLTAIIVTAGWFVPQVTQAADEYDVRIPPAAAETAVKLLARQTGHTVIFQSDDVRSVRTQAVAGKYTVRLALDALLAETDLSYSLTEGSMISVVLMPSAQVSNQEGDMRVNVQKRGIMKVVGGLAAMLVGSIAPANAQTDSGASDQVDEIVVTGRSFRSQSDSSATKLNIPLFDTAGSISVLDRELLEDIGVVDFVAATDYIPGVSTELEGYGSFFDLHSRGFSVNSNSIKMNGVPIGASRIENVALDRVEFVKGANSVYYGEVSAAGFLNLATREAPQEREISVRGELGSFDAVYGSFVIGGPLTPDGRLRALVGHSQSHTEGFMDFGDHDVRATYGTVAFDVTDRITVTGYFYDDKRRQPWNAGLPAAIDLDGNFTIFEHEPELMPTTRFTEDNADVQFVQVKIDIQFTDSMGLTIGYADKKDEGRFQYAEPIGTSDPGFFTVIDSDGNEVPGEGFPFPSLDPNSPNYGRTRLLGPFVWQETTESEYFEIRLHGEAEFGNIASAQYYLSYETRELGGQGNDIETFGWAGPNDGIFNILEPNYAIVDPYENVGPLLNEWGQNNQVDSISAVASLKFFEDIRMNLGYRRDDRGGTTFFNDFFDPFSTQSDFDNSLNSYGASLVYSLHETVNAYYAYGEAYNYLLGQDCNAGTLDPEEGTQHEIGLKWQPNPRLLGTVAFFDVTTSGSLRQVGLCPVGTARENQGAQINSDTEAFARGVELELIGNLTPQWNMILGLSYVDDGFDGGFDRVSPEKSLSLFTTYDFDTGPLRGLGLGIGAKWAVDRPFAEELPVSEFNGAELGDYFRLDAAAYYQLNDNMRLALNVNNLNDEEYYGSSGDLCCAFSRKPPRSVKFSVIVDY